MHWVDTEPYILLQEKAYTRDRDTSVNHSEARLACLWWARDQIVEYEIAEMSVINLLDRLQDGEVLEKFFWRLSASNHVASLCFHQITSPAFGNGSSSRLSNRFISLGRLSFPSSNRISLPNCLLSSWTLLCQRLRRISTMILAPFIFFSLTAGPIVIVIVLTDSQRAAKFVIFSLHSRNSASKFSQLPSYYILRILFATISKLASSNQNSLTGDTCKYFPPS